MAFKEGVDEERVQWFRNLVQIARNLDSEIDSGMITPDEAFETLDKTMSGMGKAAKKAEKAPEKANKQVEHSASR